MSKAIPRKRLPFDDDRQQERIRQRRAESLRHDSGERPDPNPNQHGQKDMGIGDIIETLNYSAI